MMMFITQYDGHDGEMIAVEGQGAALPASQQAEVALTEVPGTAVECFGPKAAGLTTVFRIKTDAGQRLVAVDPHAGEVLQIRDRRADWFDRADNIHSTLLIGSTRNRLLDVAAAGQQYPSDDPRHELTQLVTPIRSVRPFPRSGLGRTLQSA